MRSYGQFCAVARALDVVGDRWSLLIVRELLVHGSLRYTDLRDGLPGIATNLLADRLRTLDEAGVVHRVEAGPPVATTLYELTPWGAELGPAMHALGRWGARLMARGQGDDAFRSEWLVLPMSWLADSAPGEPPLAIEVRAGDEPLALTVDGTVQARPGTVEHPDAVLEGPADAVVGLLLGRLDSAAATARGLRIEGDPAALRRLRPPPLSASADEPDAEVAKGGTAGERSRRRRRRSGKTA